jgi:hypothetical protein
MPRVLPVDCGRVTASASTSAFLDFASGAAFAAAEGLAEAFAGFRASAEAALDLREVVGLVALSRGAVASGAAAAFPTLIVPCGSILGRRDGVRADRLTADSVAPWFREAPFAAAARFLLEVSEPLTRRESRAGVPFDIGSEG